jgi:hypothetical protein
MDAGSLIAATSNVSSDDELPEHLDNLKIPPAVGLLFKDLAAHLGNEIDISLTHPSAGAQVRIIGNGLNLVVRNLAKYLESNIQ